VAAFVVMNVEVSGGSELVEQQIETTTTTVMATTTTIDWSFLNTTTTTTTVPEPVQISVQNNDVGDGSRWDLLAQCESGGNWAYPPVAGGFSGGIMFHIGTWLANGGAEFAGDAYLASREQQIIVAEKVLESSGWGAWPGCSRKFGWL